MVVFRFVACLLFMVILLSGVLCCCFEWLFVGCVCGFLVFLCFVVGFAYVVIVWLVLIVLFCSFIYVISWFVYLLVTVWFSLVAGLCSGCFWWVLVVLLFVL